MRLGNTDVCSLLHYAGGKEQSNELPLLGLWGLKARNVWGERYVQG